MTERWTGRATRRTMVAGCLVLAACAPKSGLMHRLPDAGVIATPPPDKALVIFLRPALTGGGISAAVYADERFLGIVMRDARLVHEAEPGAHRYMVVSEAADFLDAELEGGRMYFIMVRHRQGAWRLRFSLLPVTPRSPYWSRLGDWLDDSYPVTPNAAGEAWARANADSVARKRSKYLPGWTRKADRPTLAPGDGVAQPPQSYRLQ